ncbi:uncharacterized protein LOC113378284 [Ctenocephalides felis]|uniref:uncharacterized protein LOC113378284 n=1 Tax=Ctenocephalides felis TaxID=7515 RepID=UPI000E6E37DB|nr:uncharacterized protein LOC113378284 [Ctenocephalides felis]
MITRSVFICVVLFAAIVNCHPTVYKRNQYDHLEPDMIAVSSTVIPVPEYNIHTNIENVESADDKTIKSKFSMMFPLKQYFMKMHKADEPYKLITVQSKKAAYQALRKAEEN